MEYVWSKLSRSLDLFDFKCSIVFFVSFPVGAPAGKFLVSGDVCLVIMLGRCWKVREISWPSDQLVLPISKQNSSCISNANLVAYVRLPR
jgi:hypothetical protein